MLSLLAGLALAVWVYLTFFRGGFWRTDQRIGDDAVEHLEKAPEIVAIVPARNEADVIADTVNSLLNLEYSDPFSIILIDDGSADGPRDSRHAKQHPTIACQIRLRGEGRKNVAAHFTTDKGGCCLH